MWDTNGLYADYASRTVCDFLANDFFACALFAARIHLRGSFTHRSLSIK